VKSVGNLRRRRLNRATALLTPVLVASLCTVGVIAPPAITFQGARASHALLSSEVRALAHSVSRLAEIEEEGGADRILAATERLRRLIPKETPELELHGVVRAAAQLAGVRLQALFLGDHQDVGLPRIEGDYVGRRVVRISAECTPDSFVRFVENLRSVGLPVSVTDLSLARSGSAGATFLVETSLSLFEHTTPPRTESEDIEL